MAIDAITSLDLVLANGTSVQASSSQNKDLFWAMRGAGPGLAVVTSFKLKTFAAPSVNINWSYTYPFKTAAFGAKALSITQKWGLESAPKELGYGVVISPGNIVIRGVYYGSQSTFKTIIAPLLALLKQANGGVDPSASVRSLGWIASLTDLAGEPLVIPKYGYDEHDNFVSPQPAFPLQALTDDGNSMPSRW